MQYRFKLRSAFSSIYHDVDFSIFKDTDINGEIAVALRTEIFNIFNHPNFSNPLLPSFAADMTSSIDPVTGRGTGFLPITVTPTSASATHSWTAVDQGTFSWR